MAYPRHQLVSTTKPGHYHCISRCVRRSFLCGVDELTGQSYEHRRQWIEDRLLELAGIFSISVYAYAVMSNHTHVVLHVDPDAGAAWTDEEVAQRWLRLYPLRKNGVIDEDACRRRIEANLMNPKIIAKHRQRLCDLPWFMRCLNEPIARRANYEDACKGRFWEGRYKCQALLDEAALLSCMAYVDLNPIRAGIAQDLPSSAHTSICLRLHKEVPEGALLLPVAGPETGARLGTNLKQYVELVEWTGRRRVEGKRGAITGAPPAILTRYGFDTDSWNRQVSSTESGYWRAIGHLSALLDKAREIGQCWLKGCGIAAQRLRLRQAFGP